MHRKLSDIGVASFAGFTGFSGHYSLVSIMAVSPQEMIHVFYLPRRYSEAIHNTTKQKHAQIARLDRGDLFHWFSTFVGNDGNLCLFMYTFPWEGSQTA